MKKYKPFLILAISCLIPLLFTTTIPYALPTSLHLNSRKSTEHAWDYDIRLYTISLVESSHYTIDVDIDVFWGMDIELRIAETPYMISGFSVDSGSTTGETMHYTPSKTGTYFIQVKINSGSGFYDIEVESGTTGSATGSTLEYFDISYLLVLLLPSVFILIVGLLILRRRAKKPEKKPTINVYRKQYWEKLDKDVEIKKEEMMICEFCGSEIKKSLKKCPHCNASLNYNNL
ncbi:MAG: hypothetical protein ACFFCV_03560 [Promethearchaeota archaeon]